MRARSSSVRFGRPVCWSFPPPKFALALTYTSGRLRQVPSEPAYQAVRGEVTPLHPSALARHVADRIIQTHADSLLGEVMIEHAVHDLADDAGDPLPTIFCGVGGFSPFATSTVGVRS